MKEPSSSSSTSVSAIACTSNALSSSLSSPIFQTNCPRGCPLSAVHSIVSFAPIQRMINLVRQFTKIIHYQIPFYQISNDNYIYLPSDRCSVPKGSTETLADLAIFRLTTPSDNSPLSSRAVFREHYMYGKKFLISSSLLVNV